MTRNHLTGLFALTFAFSLIACNKYSASEGYVPQGDAYALPPGNVGNIDSITENQFIKTADSSVTTFSVDADGGSYAITRKLLNENLSLSEYRKAIRIEEFINYFTYNYPDAADGQNIAVNGEVSGCPWNAEHRLVRIGIKGKSLIKSAYPAANFVLLIDVSGSMSSPDKLDLLKKGMITFTEQMRNNDRIAIVTYAGSESVALPSTTGADKLTIINAINKLGSGGSTNGAGGIKKAYEIARENFIEGGNNRVLLGTDGDFNVGITNTDELVDLVIKEKEKGIFLTTLGVGLGNFNESMMEKLADKGDGNYEYLDSEEEMKKLFIDEYSKFVTIAKDVKIQVAFNKDVVEEYRLLGYENRSLKNQDFEDDEKDAGDIGAGQTVTAIYEIKPKQNVNLKLHPAFNIDFRYKKTGSAASIPLSLDIYDEGKSFESSSENMRFAASLAALGLYLRNSAFKGSVTLNDVRM